MTDFLPGLEMDDEQMLDESEPLPPDSLSIPNRETSTPDLKSLVVVVAVHRFDPYVYRARQFLCSLPEARRRAISRRPRFRNQPNLRLAREADSDDLP